MNANDALNEVLQAAYSSVSGERDYLLVPARRALVTLSDNHVHVVSKELSAVFTRFVEANIDDWLPSPAELDDLYRLRDSYLETLLMYTR
jgi:hypothetical protein